MEAPMGGGERGLIAYWNFDEGPNLNYGLTIWNSNSNRNIYRRRWNDGV